MYMDTSSGGLYDHACAVLGGGLGGGPARLVCGGGRINALGDTTKKVNVMDIPEGEFVNGEPITWQPWRPMPELPDAFSSAGMMTLRRFA